MEDYIKVGKVKEAHGLMGDLYLLLFTNSRDWLELITEVFLQKTEEPFNVNHARRIAVTSQKKFKKGILLKSEDLESRTEAELYKGWFWYIPKSLLKTESQDQFYLHEILGFKVFTEENSVFVDRGVKVSGFSTNGVQDLAIVTTSQGDFEIPLVDEFIFKIDYQDFCIYLKIPEGLVEWG